MGLTVGDLISDLELACQSLLDRPVTPMPDGSYKFEIHNLGIHAVLDLRVTSNFRETKEHTHRYIPQPIGETPRCCDCGWEKK